MTRKHKEFLDLGSMGLPVLGFNFDVGGVIVTLNPAQEDINKPEHITVQMKSVWLGNEAISYGFQDFLEKYLETHPPQSLLDLIEEKKQLASNP